jgi:L-asparaginase / beta-aspartyl-peptidase
MPPFGLVIHGGAGAINRGELPPGLDAAFRQALAAALDGGHTVLAGGGSALDAVIAAVTSLEDCPLFNAGRGSVLSADGLCELDASIMNGRTLEAGAVTGVRTIRNPIALARDVMEKSAHVMMAGRGAEKFAETLGHAPVPNTYFQTDFRRAQLLQAQKLGDATGTPPKGRVTFSTVDDNALIAQLKYGTVGCVALDQHGNLAAGTSTGGMTNKQFGRVGDSPIIGAGTYANNATCAISATGWGEYFIRASVAHDISAQMEYQHASLQTAAAATIAKVGRLGGSGGVIGIDAQGNITLTFNSAGMYRAHRVAGRPAVVALYGDE